MQVGDYIINDDGDILKITSIGSTEYYVNSKGNTEFVPRSKARPYEYSIGEEVYLRFEHEINKEEFKLLPTTFTFLISMRSGSLLTITRTGNGVYDVNTDSSIEYSNIPKSIIKPKISKVTEGMLKHECIVAGARTPTVCIKTFGGWKKKGDNNIITTCPSCGISLALWEKLVSEYL